MAKDMLGRDVVAGDFIVSYNNIYKVEEELSEKYVRALLHHKTPSTRPKKIYATEMLLIPRDDVLVWILKGK